MSFAFSLPIQPENIYNFQTIKDCGYGALLETSIEGFHYLPDEHIIWLHTTAKFHLSDASLKDITTCYILTNFRLIFIEKQSLVYSIGYDSIVSTEHVPSRAFTKDILLIGLKSSSAAYNPAYTLNLPSSALSSAEIRLQIADKAILIFFLEFLQLIAQYRFEQVQQRNTQGLESKHWYIPPGIMKICEIPLSISLFASHRLIAYQDNHKNESHSNNYPPTDTIIYINTKLAQAIHDQLVFLQDKPKLQKLLLSHCFLQYNIRLVGNVDQGQVHTGTRQGKHVKWRSKFSEHVLLPGLSYPYQTLTLIAPQIFPPQSTSTTFVPTQLELNPWDLPTSTRQRSTASRTTIQHQTSPVLDISSTTPTQSSTSLSISSQSPHLTSESPIIHFKQPLLFKYTDLHPTAALQFNLQLTVSLHAIQAVKSYLQDYQTDSKFDLAGHLSSITTNPSGLLPFEQELCTLATVGIDMGQTSVPFSAFASIPFLQLSIPLQLNDISANITQVLDQSKSMEYPTIQQFINQQHQLLTQSELVPLSLGNTTTNAPANDKTAAETRRRNASIIDENGHVVNQRGGLGNKNDKENDSSSLVNQDVQILLLNTPILQEFQQDAALFKDTLKSTVKYVLNVTATKDSMASSTTLIDSIREDDDSDGNPFDSDGTDDDMLMVVPKSHLQSNENSSQDDQIEHSTPSSNPFDDISVIIDETTDPTHDPSLQAELLSTPTAPTKTSTPTKTIPQPLSIDITVDGILASELAEDDISDGTHPIPQDIVGSELIDDQGGNPFADVEDDVIPPTPITTAIITPEIAPEIAPKVDIIQPNNLKSKTEKKDSKKNSKNDSKKDSKPVDSKPVDSKPVDSKPVDSKPVDSKPVDSKPVDSKPVDSKSNDSKPVASPKPIVEEIITPPPQSPLTETADIVTMLPIPLPPPLKQKQPQQQLHQDQPIVKMSSRITKKFTRHTTDTTPIPESPKIAPTISAAINDTVPHQQTLTVRSVYNGVDTLIQQQEAFLQLQQSQQPNADNIGRVRHGSITDTATNTSNKSGSTDVAGIMQFDDFIWEYQRLDKNSNNWTTPYLSRDPYPFSDSKNGETYKTLDSVSLKPWWKWHNQWSVVMDAELIQSIQEENKLFKNDPLLIQQSTLAGLSQLVLGNQTPGTSSKDHATPTMTPTSNGSSMIASEFSLVDPQSISRRGSASEKDSSKDNKDIKRGGGIFGKLKANRNKETIPSLKEHDGDKISKLDPESASSTPTSTPLLTPRPSASLNISDTFSTFLRGHNTLYSISLDTPPIPISTKSQHDIPIDDQLQALLNKTLPQSHFAAHLLLLALPHRNVPYFSPHQFIKDNSEANIFRKAFTIRHGNDHDSNMEPNRDARWLELCQILKTSLEHTQIQRIQQRGDFYSIQGHVCDMSWDYAPHVDDKLNDDKKHKDKDDLQPYRMDSLPWSNIWAPGCTLRRRCWVRTRVYAGPHYPTCPCEFCFSMESCFQQDAMTATQNKSPLMNFTTGDIDLDTTLKLYTPNIQKIQLTLLSMNISSIISEIYAQMTRYDKEHSHILIKQPHQLQIPSTMTAQTIPLLVGINWVDIQRKMKVIETILTHDRRYATQVLPALQQFIEQGGTVSSHDRITDLVTSTDDQFTTTTKPFTSRRPSRASLYQRPQGFRGGKKTSTSDVDENELYYSHWISPTLWAQYHNLLSILLPSATLALTQYLPFIDVRYIEKCITSEINPKNLLNYVIDFTELKQATQLVEQVDSDDDCDTYSGSKNPFDSDDDNNTNKSNKKNKKQHKEKSEELKTLSLDDFDNPDAGPAGNPFSDDDDDDNGQNGETVVNFDQFSKLSKTERQVAQRFKQQEILSSLREFNKHLQAASIAHQHAKELCTLLETYAKRAKVLQRDIQRVNAIQIRRNARSQPTSPATTDQPDQPDQSDGVLPPKHLDQTSKSSKTSHSNSLSLLCPYQTASQQFHLPPKTSIELQNLGIASETSIPSPQYLISQVMLIFANVICSGFDLAFNPTSPPIYSLPVVSIHGKPIIPPGYSVYNPTDLKTMETQLEKKRSQDEHQGGTKFSTTESDKINVIQPQPLGLYTACNCCNAACIDAKIRGHVHFYHQLHAPTLSTLIPRTPQFQAQTPQSSKFTASLLQRATNLAINGVEEQPATGLTQTPTPTISIANTNTLVSTTYQECPHCLKISPQYKTQDSTGINAVLQLWPRRLAYIARFLQFISFIEQTGVIPRSWNLPTTVLKTINYINVYHFTAICVLSGVPEPLYIFQPTHALLASSMYRNFLQVQPQFLTSLPTNDDLTEAPQPQALVSQQQTLQLEPNYIFPGSINHNIAGALFQHPLTQFACKQQLTTATILQHTYTPKQLFSLYKQLTDSNYFNSAPSSGQTNVSTVQLPIIAHGQSPQQTSLQILKFLSTHIDLLSPTNKYIQQFKQPMNFYFFTQTLLHTIETHHSFSKKHKNIEMMKTYIFNTGGSLGSGPSPQQITGLLNEMLSLSFLEASFLRTNTFLQTLPSILHHPIPIRLDYPFHHYFYFIRKELVSTMMSNIKTFISSEIFIANPIILHPPQITTFLATSNNIGDLLHEASVHSISDDVLINLHYKANGLHKQSTLSTLFPSIHLPFSSNTDQKEITSVEQSQYQNKLDQAILKYNNPTSYSHYFPQSITSSMIPTVRTPYYNHPLVSLLPPTPFDPHEVININSCLSNKTQSTIPSTTTASTQPPTPSTGAPTAPQPTAWLPLSSQNMLYPVLKSTSSNVLQQLGLISEEQCLLIVDPESPQVKKSIAQSGQDLNTQRDSVVRTIQELLLSSTNINTMPKEIASFLPHITSSTIQSISPLQSVESIFIYAKKQYKKIGLLLQHNPILLSIICNDLLTCFDVYYCYLFHILASPHAQPTPLPTISRLIAISQQPESIQYNATLTTIQPLVFNQPSHPVPQQASSGGFFSGLLAGAIDVTLSKPTPPTPISSTTPTVSSSRSWFGYLQNKSRNFTQSLLTIIKDGEIVTQLNPPSNLAPGQPIPHNLELSGFSPWWLQFAPHPSNLSGTGVPVGPLRLQEYQVPTIYPKFQGNGVQDNDAIFDLHFNPLQHQLQVQNDQYKSILCPLSPYFDLYHYTLAMTSTLSSITPYAAQLSNALITLAKTGLVQHNSSQATASKLQMARGLNPIDSFDSIDNKNDHAVGARGVLIYDTIPFETSLSITLTIDRFIQSIELLIQYIAGSLDPIDQLLLEYRHLIPEKDLEAHNFDPDFTPHGPKPLEHAVQMLSSFNFSAGSASDEKYLNHVQEVLSDSIQHISDVKKYSTQIYFSLIDNMYKLRKSAITQALTVLVPSLAVSLGNVSPLMRDLNANSLGHQTVFYDHLAAQLGHRSRFVSEILRINTNQSSPLLFTPRFFYSRTTPPQYTQAITPYEASTYSSDFVMKYYHFHQTKQSQTKQTAGSSGGRGTPKFGPANAPTSNTTNTTASSMTSQMTRMSVNTTTEAETAFKIAQEFKEANGGDSTNPFDDASDQEDQLFSSYLAKHQAEYNNNGDEEETFDSLFGSQHTAEASMTSRIFGNQTKSHLESATQKQLQRREEKREERQHQRAVAASAEAAVASAKHKTSLVGMDDFLDAKPVSRHSSINSKSGNLFDDSDDDTSTTTLTLDKTRSRPGSSTTIDAPQVIQDITLDNDDLDDPLLAYYASFGAVDDYGEGEYDDDDEDYAEVDAVIQYEIENKISDDAGTVDDEPIDLKQYGEADESDSNDEKDIAAIECEEKEEGEKTRTTELTASGIIDSIVDSDDETSLLSKSLTASPPDSISKILLTATMECGLPFEIAYLLEHLDSSQISQQFPTYYDLAHHAVLPSEFIKHFIAALLGLDTSTIHSHLLQNSNSSRQEIKPAPTTSLLTVLSLLADKPTLFNVTLKNIFSSLLLPLLIGSYGEYIPFNLKSIPLPPPPLDNEPTHPKTHLQDFSTLVDTQYLCNHIPLHLRNPQLLTLPLQQLISDFSATHTLIPTLITLDLSSISPFFFTTPLGNHQISSGSTLVSTTTKHDIVDYHTTLQRVIGIDGATASTNTLKLSFKEKQTLKSQDRFKKEWKKLLQAQEFLPRLGGWIGYCAGFVELFHKLQIDISSFLPTPAEMGLLLSLPLQNDLSANITGPSALSKATKIDVESNTVREANVPLLSSKLLVRLDLFDQLKMHTPSESNPNPPPLQPQDMFSLTQHIRSHLLFLFYSLRLGKITPNSLQWCTILMNYTSTTSYLLASLYIQHAPYDAKPVWIKF